MVQPCPQQTFNIFTFLCDISWNTSEVVNTYSWYRSWKWVGAKQRPLNQPLQQISPEHMKICHFLSSLQKSLLEPFWIEWSFFSFATSRCRTLNCSNKMNQIDFKIKDLHYENILKVSVSVVCCIRGVMGSNLMCHHQTGCCNLSLHSPTCPSPSWNTSACTYPVIAPTDNQN